MKFISAASLCATAMLLAVPLTAVNATPASTLSSLSEIQDALDQGAGTVAVAIDLSRCNPVGDTKKAGKAKGGLTIGAYLFMDGVLSFSDSHPTVSNNGDPLWQFLRYQVKPDQTVLFTADMFSLPTYSRVGVRVSYQCSINQGIKFTRQ